MKITILGTGNAQVTECYNTCYVLSSEEGSLLVDGGGGSMILIRLKQAGIDVGSIHHIIVTHKHIDHVLGIIWMMRVICQNMNSGSYEGDAFIYAHKDLSEMLMTLAEMLLNKKEVKLIGKRVHLVPVEDGEKKTILGHEYTFSILGLRKPSSTATCWIWETDAGSPAAGTSPITSGKKYMQRAATGCFMRPSA